MVRCTTDADMKRCGTALLKGVGDVLFVGEASPMIEGFFYAASMAPDAIDVFANTEWKALTLGAVGAITAFCAAKSSDDGKKNDLKGSLEASQPEHESAVVVAERAAKQGYITSAQLVIIQEAADTLKQVVGEAADTLDCLTSFLETAPTVKVVRMYNPNLPYAR